MTGALRWRAVVFSQVSVFLPCWVVRWLAIHAERFARIVHASDVFPAVANTLVRPGAGYRLSPEHTTGRVVEDHAVSERHGVSRTGRRGFRLRNSRAAL